MLESINVHKSCEVNISLFRKTDIDSNLDGPITTHPMSVNAQAKDAMGRVIKW